MRICSKSSNTNMIRGIIQSQVVVRIEFHRASRHRSTFCNLSLRNSAQNFMQRAANWSLRSFISRPSPCHCNLWLIRYRAAHSAVSITSGKASKAYADDLAAKRRRTTEWKRRQRVCHSSYYFISLIQPLLGTNVLRSPRDKRPRWYALILRSERYVLTLHVWHRERR